MNTYGEERLYPPVERQREPDGDSVSRDSPADILDPLDDPRLWPLFPVELEEP